MAKINGFKALTYNRIAISNMSEVLSPPYDVIGQKDYQALNAKSPWNAVNLDSYNHPAEENAIKTYEDSKKTIDTWVQSNILTHHQKPILFILEDHFVFQGQALSRMGILCVVELEPLGKNILPHEQILAKPLEDRIRLLDAAKTHLSPFFLLCNDKKNILRQKLQHLTTKYAKESFAGFDEEKSHNLWTVTDPQDIQTLAEHMVDQKLLIADGHHRYQTALLYSQKEENKLIEDAKWGLAYITLFPGDGLVLSAYHRRVEMGVSIPNILEKLTNHFDISSYDLDWTSFENQRDLVGLIDTSNSKLHTLRLKKNIDDLPPKLAKIPSCLLNYFLKEYLSIDVTTPSGQAQVKYESAPQKLLHKVTPHEMGVWLKPAQVEDVFKAAEDGFRLPPKSTFFYPKVPTGIGFHPIRD